MRTTDRVINKIALPILISAGMLLILFVVIQSKGTSSENNAYIRVINCIVSYPASSRTQENIETCYTTVEHDSSIHLQRYDSSRK